LRKTRGVPTAEIKEIKTSQAKIKKKNAITEMQNQLDVLTRMGEAEKLISDIKVKIMGGK